MNKKVLVILYNRFTPGKKVSHFELSCKPDGTVLSEVKLKGKPRQPVYDEVWENDDGKTDIDSCTRMKRHYKHRLIKPKGA